METSMGRWGRRAYAAACLSALSAAGALAPGAAEGAAPTLRDVSQSASVWRESSSLAAVSDAAAPVGTTFSFRIDESAHVTLTFVPAYSGRRICRLHAGTRTCTRVVAQATLSFIAHRGANRV